MVYDLKLAARVSVLLANTSNLTEKKMFGGVGYLVNGNMACGVHQDHLIVRVGPNAYQDAQKEPGTKLFDLTGRPMKGWVMVSSVAIEEDEILRE